MEVVFNLMQGIIIVAIEVFCCVFFFESFFYSRETKYTMWLKAIMPLLVIVIYIGSSFLQKHIIIKSIFTFMMITVIMHFCFETKFLVGMIFVAIFQGLIYGIDYSVLSIFATIDLSTNPEHIMVILISKMLLLVSVIIIQKKWGLKNFFSAMTDKEWFKFLYFPLATIIILVISIVNFHDISNEKLLYVIILISFLLIGLNVFLLCLIRDIVEREQKIREKSLFNERAVNEMKIYQVLTENYQRERKKTHEYKNHMNCIEGMLKQGEIDATVKYVEKITGGLSQEVNIIDTNNVYINSVLNAKYQEANANDIIFVLQVNDLSNIFIHDEDLVVILSNLLNNAISECKRKEKDRKIWLKFVDEENMTIISVKNTCLLSSGSENKILRTIKSNNIRHGFGISNIKDIVLKYNGSCVIKHIDYLYSFTIIIPHD